MRRSLDGFRSAAVDGISLTGVLAEYSGQLATIDTRYSACRIAVNVAACGAVDGDYDGLVFYRSANDILYIGTDNGQWAFAVRLDRQ